MFIDEKFLTVISGKGGDGAVLFRHEKYVPHGGPDGGDGGRGGSIFVEGRGNLHTLSDLAHVDRIKAEDGQGGSHKQSFGKSGEDTLIPVPLGTAIYSGDKLLTEILNEGDKFLLVKGGNGGWGNSHFKSSVQQAPDHANPGQPSQTLAVTLVLKLIADIGLVGLPNSGKSTFLSVVSAAKPKIADYPFTTLEPQLGVAQITHGKEKQSLVIADLPGLIEGAHEGKGLGIDFLKHLERTKAIIHFVDSSLPDEEIVRAYYMIRQELAAWSPIMAKKPEIVVLSKTDTLPPEEQVSTLKAVQAQLKLPVFLLSAVTHEGLSEVLTAAYNLVS